MRDLLHAQRVSRRFKSVIAASTKLQQQLYFKSSPGGPLEYMHDNGYERPCDPPMSKGGWAVKGKSELVKPVLNPLFHDLFVRDGQYWSANMAARTRPESSWKRMLLASPSIASVVVEPWNEDGCWCETHSSPPWICAEEGLTMGLLANRVWFMFNDTPFVLYAWNLLNIATSTT